MEIEKVKVLGIGIGVLAVHVVPLNRLASLQIRRGPCRRLDPY